MFSYCMRICVRLETLDVLISQKVFWELILYSQFVPMSYGSFVMKVVMIG